MEPRWAKGLSFAAAFAVLSLGVGLGSCTKGAPGAAGEAAPMEAAKAAFAPDAPGVAFGPITRFGTLQLTLPWRGRPVSEVLN